MARTKGTRRLPPHASYAASARTTAQVQARVPPTRRQYERAFDYYDETTILDYLRLAPSIERDMDATNAYITRHQRSPPAFSSAGSETDPYVWFWPYRWCRLIKPVTLFVFAAQYGLADVLSWLFCDRNRATRLSTTLSHVFKDTLCAATEDRHAHIVEMLLRSPVYLEELTDEPRQLALNNAFCHASKGSVCEQLIAHGASVIVRGRMNLPWVFVSNHDSQTRGRHQAGMLSVSSREFTANSAIKMMQLAVWREDTDALEHGMREAVVVDHSVLVAAVLAVNVEAVRLLISRGFVDVDARSRDGLTAVLVCATEGDQYDGSERRERRQEVLRTLLDAGADTTLRDPQGRTALHVAIMKSNLSSVQVLLDHVIETNGVRAVHDDKTVLAMAFERRNSEGAHSECVLTALLERGACAKAHGELVTTGQQSGACENPNRCLRDLKRKRGDYEETVKA